MKLIGESMKSLKIAVIFPLAFLISCSHLNSENRTPSSIQVIDDFYGAVILLYKDGQSIIVKDCKGKSDLGASIEEARRNCEGISNEFPVDVFKKNLKDIISSSTILAITPMNPLTKEELESYKEDCSNSEKMKLMNKELDELNEFIETYGAKNGELYRKEDLLKKLCRHKTRASAIQKINSEIDRAIGLIADQSNYVISESRFDKKNKPLYRFLKQMITNKDQLLFMTLSVTGPYRKTPCGLDGSVEERIQNCSYQSHSSQGNFILVTRTLALSEVYKDITTGLLWGSGMDTEEAYDVWTHQSAGLACLNDSHVNAKGGMMNLKWRLPTIEEFKIAYENGITNTIDAMKGWYWSSTIDEEDSDYAKMFDGKSNKSFSYLRSLGPDKYNHRNGESYGTKARCVAEP